MCCTIEDAEDSIIRDSQYPSLRLGPEIAGYICNAQPGVHEATQSLEPATPLLQQPSSHFFVDMTPAQIKALTPGANINDGTGATATVTFTRDYSSAIEIDGVLEIRWTAPAGHVGKISVFNYRDPALRRWT